MLNSSSLFFRPRNEFISASASSEFSLPKVEFSKDRSGNPIVLSSDEFSTIRCIILGPRPLAPNTAVTAESQTKGSIQCIVEFIPVSLGTFRFLDSPGDLNEDYDNNEGNMNDLVQKAKMFFETSVVQALNETILLDKFPKSILEIRLQIISFSKLDASLFMLPNIVNAASLAILANRIETKGVVICAREQNLVIAMCPSLEMITLLEMKLLKTDQPVEMTELGNRLSKTLQTCSLVNTLFKQQLINFISS